MALQSARRTAEFVGPQGPQGPKGPAGPQGIQGVAGPSGSGSSADTVAHLISLVNPPAFGSIVVAVAAYATSNDGGGGLFTWSPGSSATSNGVTIVSSTVVGAPPGRWLRQYDGYVDPRWAGGIGDGATDARTALATCDAIGPIVVPPGTWRVASALTLAHDVQVVDGGVLAPDSGVTLTLAKPPIAGDVQRIFGGSGLCNVQGEVSFCWYMLASDGSNIGPAMQHFQDSQINNPNTNGNAVGRLPAGTWTWADQPTPVWNYAPAGIEIEVKAPGMNAAITLTGGGRQRLFVGNQHGRLKIDRMFVFGSGSTGTVDCSNFIQVGNCFDMDVDMQFFNVLTSADGFGMALFNGTGPGNLRIVMSGCGVSATGTILGGKLNVKGFEQGCATRYSDGRATVFGEGASKNTGTRPAVYIGAQEINPTANGFPWTVDVQHGDADTHAIYVDPSAGNTMGRMTVRGYFEGSYSQAAIQAHDTDAIILREAYFNMGGGGALAGNVAVQLNANCPYLDIEGGWLDGSAQIVAQNSPRLVSIRRVRGGIYAFTGAGRVYMTDVTPGEIRPGVGSGEPFVPMTKAIAIVGPTQLAELTNVVCDLVGVNSDGAAPNRIFVDNQVQHLVERDCVSALDDIHALVHERIVGGITQRIANFSSGSTREEMIADVSLTGVTSLGGTATFNVLVEPGALVRVRSEMSSVNDSGGATGTSGFRKRSHASFGGIGAQATKSRAGSGGFNPKDNPFLDDTCDNAYVNAGTESTATWQQGSGSPNSVNAQLVVTNQAAAAKNFDGKIEIVRDWNAFNPSMFARLLGTTCKEIWLPQGLQNSAGSVSAWQGSLARIDMAPTGTVSYIASAGPNNLPAARFAGTGHLSATLAARKQGTLAIVGSIGGNAQTMAALSASTSAWGGATSGNVRLATEIVSPDSSQSREYCERSTTTGLLGGGTGNGIVADPGNYHNRIITWFRGVDGTQAFGAAIYRGGVGASNVDKAVVTMASNTSLFIADQQGGGFAMTGDVQLVVYFDQALQADQIAALAGYMQSLTGAN